MVEDVEIISCPVRQLVVYKCKDFKNRIKI